MENVNTTIPSEATITAPLPNAEEVFTEPVKVVDNGSKPKAKKTATPKKRARDVKELINAATKNMTDKEKDNLIEYVHAADNLNQLHHVGRIEEVHTNNIVLDSLCNLGYRKG